MRPRRWLRGRFEVSDKIAQGLKDKDSYLDDLRDTIEDLKQLVPGSRQAQMFAAQASAAVVGLQKLYPQLEDSANKAHTALAEINEFVLTFKDNPARRLLSLYVGMVVGLIVAVILGLDMIQATIGDPFPGKRVNLLTELVPNLGTAITGIVVGLGANPTHELIKTLQTTKERRKATARHQETPPTTREREPTP
jgi:uncharacterized protein YacL